MWQGDGRVATPSADTLNKPELTSAVGLGRVKTLPSFPMSAQCREMAKKREQ
jgi:hypothetical protein